jgi:hypothetical protein
LIQPQGDWGGREWKKAKEIGTAFCNYYQNLFLAGDTRGVEESLQYVETRVTDEMNVMLLKEYTTEEVERALSQMHPLKSLGRMDFWRVFIKNLGPRRNTRYV